MKESEVNIVVVLEAWKESYPEFEFRDSEPFRDIFPIPEYKEAVSLYLNEASDISVYRDRELICVVQFDKPDKSEEYQIMRRELNSSFCQCNDIFYLKFQELASLRRSDLKKPRLIKFFREVFTGERKGGREEIDLLDEEEEEDRRC